LIEEFEYTGVWWIPDKPEKKIHGTLRFTSDEGATLSLTGSFKDLVYKIKNIKEIFRPEIILGISSDGKFITLYKCFETTLNINLSGFLISSFYANVVFIDAHFQKSEDIKFKNISVHYLYLDEWVDFSGFDIKKLDIEKKEMVSYILPEPFQACINDNLNVLIEFRFSYQTPSMKKEMSIKQKTWIKIETSEPKSLKDYEKYLYYIQNFLTLGTTEPVYPLAIEGITEVNKKIIEIKGNFSPYYPPVKIFYRFNTVRKMNISSCDMLFTFKDIYDKFGTFLRKWFGQAVLLEPVYNLYFGTLYNPHMYLNQRFLSLIQALESFHQRKFGGKYLTKEEDYNKIYNALKNSIPDNVRSDLKGRLKEYLKYGNEFSLRKRLEEIFEKYKEILDKFIENQDAFIELAINTRNYLTHYDEKLEGKAAREKELFFLTENLKTLLEVCLLTELGFNIDETVKLFEENKKYKHKFIL